MVAITPPPVYESAQQLPADANGRLSAHLLLLRDDCGYSHETQAKLALDNPQLSLVLAKGHLARLVPGDCPAAACLGLGMVRAGLTAGATEGRRTSSLCDAPGATPGFCQPSRRGSAHSS